MEETLKDARLIHRLLIGFSAVLCLFSLSSPSAVNFGPPKRVLKCLHDADVGRLKADIDSALAVELNKTGFSRELQNYNVGSPPIPLDPKHFRWNQYEAIDQAKGVLDNQSVVKIVEYLSERHPITVFLPDMRELFQILTQERDVFERNRSQLSNAFHIDVSAATNRPDLGYGVSLNWIHPDPFQASQGIGRFENLGGPNIHGSQTILGSLDVSGWVNLQCGNTTLTKELHQVWDDIRDDDLARAVLRLESMESRTARSVEITSLHIPSSFALVAGPLVLWFLLLTLLSHVRHANELSSAESEILYSFGWEPLYDATIARVLAFSSVVLLPTLASLLLLIYAPSLTRPIWISALIETVLVVITALIVWLALCRIQRSNPALNAT